jgi:PAS domain S-box-containing protein
MRAVSPEDTPRGNHAQAAAEALAEVGRELVATLDLSRVMQLIVSTVLRLHDCKSAALYRLDPASGELRCMATAGRADPAAWTGQVLMAGQGVAGRAIATGRPVFSADLLADPNITVPGWLRQFAQATGDRAIVAVPLTVRGETIGALGVGDDVGRAFTDPDVRLLTAFAAQAALALENARLFDAERRRRRESEVLTAVSRELIGSVGLEELADRIASSVLVLLGVQRALLYRCDSESGALTCIAVAGAGDPARWIGKVLPAGFGVAGLALADRRPVMSANPLRDPRVRLPEWAREVLAEQGPPSVLALPLVVDERPLGALLLDSPPGRSLPDADIQLALAFAAQAALALDKDRRYRQARATAAALGESEARYRQLVEGSVQGIWIHENFVIRFANRRVAEIFGRPSPDRLVGTDLRELAAPHERARLERYRAARLRGEPAPVRYEWEGIRADGAAVWLENVSTVVSWDGQPAILATLLDVTEVRRLEEQLRQAQKMEAIGRLAGGVAHDFNNLLTIISGRTELLLVRLPAGSQARRDAELIHETAGRAADLTRRLLAFSRGQMLMPTVLDLRDVVEGMVPMLRRLIREDVDLSLDLRDGRGWVYADRGQVEQVVLNLSANACDAMPGGGRLTLAVEAVELDEAYARAHVGARPGPHVRLAVGDTGAGMTAEVRAHLFEPFFTTKEPGKGTGLGLATVYGIVKQSDGHIGVSSEPGAGTTFEIYLPRVEAPAATIAAEPATSRGGEETILLVEDEPEVRSLARDLLEAAGYLVLEASDGEDALRVVEQREGPIHLLVTDVVMPRMSGPELAGLLVRARPELKVLYVSGYIAAEIADLGVLEPGVHFLPKPFTPVGLARKVREVLDAPGPGVP